MQIFQIKTVHTGSSATLQKSFDSSLQQSFQLPSSLLVLWISSLSWLNVVSGGFLKPHYVTLTVTRGFKKRNLMMCINTSYKIAILVKPGHILQRKRRLLYLPVGFYFSRAVPNNDPLLPPAASVCRQPTCCFQEPPWITELKQSSRRTSSP